MLKEMIVEEIEIFNKKGLDMKIEEIKTMQDELNHRTSVENKASELITNCEFEKAIELLNTI